MSGFLRVMLRLKKTCVVFLVNWFKSFIFMAYRHFSKFEASMEIDCLVSVFFGYLKANFKGVAALLYKAVVVCPEFCLMTKESYLKNAGVVLKGRRAFAAVC